MVLFIFVIMLLNVPKEQPQIEKQKGLRYLAIPFAGALIAETFYVAHGCRRVRFLPYRPSLIRQSAQRGASRRVVHKLPASF